MRVMSIHVYKMRKWVIYFANIANDIGPADQNLCEVNDPNECFAYHNSHTSILNIKNIFNRFVYHLNLIV